MSSDFISGSVTAFLRNVLPVKVAGAYLGVKGSCLPDAEASDPVLREPRTTTEFSVHLKLVLLHA